MVPDPQPRLQGFLSDHESEEELVDILAEPDPIYIEEARNSLELNFDFKITGLTNKTLVIRFIKVGVYDDTGKLVTFKHLNHNGVGQEVKRGAPIAKVGFSGASTTYSHLHYQLMDGKDFLNDNPLPCKFSDLNLILGSKTVRYDELSIDIGDLIQSVSD